jgi:hypothetical protein
MSRLTVLRGCLIAALWLGIGNVPARAAELSLRVTISCQMTSDCRALLRLTNSSARSIELYKAMLPWKRYGMLLIAAEDRSTGDILEQFRPVDDPTSETIVLPAGASLRGEIDLVDRFPTLPAKLKDVDIVLFWSYKPALKKGTHRSLSGSTTISRLSNSR